MQNKWQNSTKNWGDGKQNGIKLLWGYYIYMTLYNVNSWVGCGELHITEDATSNLWKKKTDLLYFIHTKNCTLQNIPLQILKRQDSDWAKIFVNYIPVMGIASTIYKEHFIRQ